MSDIIPKKPFPWPWIIGAVTLIMLGIGVFIVASGGSQFEPLPADSYLQKPTDYLGNKYTMRAQIESQLKWERGLGKLLAVSVEGADSQLPVFVPETVETSLHKGQRYNLQVRIEEGGLIYVESLKKY